MGSKVKNAISKRRPRQNIISMILKNAKNKGKTSVGGASTSTNTRSTASSTRSRSPSKQRSASSSSHKIHHSSGKRNGILQSAAYASSELTRRTKHVTSHASSRYSKHSSKKKRGVPFSKGQKAFYRSAKGIAKVTVVGIHHDAKLEPYYTIKLRDGKEKQTDGKHLTPIVVQEESSSSKSKGSSSRGDVNKEVVKGSSSSGNGGNSRPAAVADSLQSNEILTDPMSDSDDDDDEVIDFTEEKDHVDNDNDAEDQVAALRGGYNEYESETDHAATSADDHDDDDNEEEDYDAKKFAPGQDAYYRSPRGGVLKIRIHSYGEHHPNRYTIQLPDGGHEDNVRPSLLATLMDLTSKELSVLMKERNKRQHDHSVGGSVSGGSRSHQNAHNNGKSSSAYNGEDNGTGIVDEGYEAEEGEPTTSSSGSEQSLTPGAETKGHEEKPLLALPPVIELVQANTEEGGTKMVPYYTVGMDVYYKNYQGVQPAKILARHLDDLMEPYYDVRLEDGKEKQTDNAHIMLTREGEEEEGGKVEEEQQEEEGGEYDGMEKSQEETHEEETESQNLDEEALKLAAGMFHQEEEEETQHHHNHNHHKEESQQRRRRHSVAINPRREDAARKQRQSRKDSNLRQSLKDMVEEQLAPNHTFDKVNNVSVQDPSVDYSHSVNASALDPAPAPLQIPATFCLGDEVLYTSSQGEQCRAVVVRLQRDKKNRPYYVVRLPQGKEKQVYGHRLRPYVREDPKGGSGRRTRSRSRGAKEKKSRGRSTSKVSSAGRHGHNNGEQPPHRSESIDSKNTMSNSSRRSRASRERHNGREDTSVPSSREGRRGRDESSGPHPGSRHRDESVTRSVVHTSRRTRSPSATPSESTRKSRRDRSQSTVCRSKSNVSSASSRHDQHHHVAEPRSERKASGRERSRSRAPSDSMVSRGMSRSRARTTPTVSMNSKRAPPADREEHFDNSSRGGDDHSRSTAPRSISRLKNFRKTFANRKKKT